MRDSGGCLPTLFRTDIGEDLGPSERKDSGKLTDFAFFLPLVEAVGSAMMLRFLPT